MRTLMEVIANCTRGVIVAPEGKKLCIADLSNIEGRVLAWVGCEEWKLQAFRDFDNGTGHDLYKLAYAKSFGVPPESVDKEQRSVGKVQELALGYAGGVGAFLTFSLAYGIDLEAMGREAFHTLPGDVAEEAASFYEWMLKQGNNTFGLSREAFIVCDAFKRLWRYSNSNIAALWKELETACVEATQTPGCTMPVRSLNVRRDGGWLRIGMPSGRFICYPNPQVQDGKLSYMGMNQYTRKWERINTHGGKLIENCVQSLARDVLADNMQRAEDEGYQIVLSVHDELLTETPDTADYSHERLAEIMATVPEWATGMPLAAAGFEAYRYRKG